MSKLLGLRDEAVALDVDACMTWVLRFIRKQEEEASLIKLAALMKLESTNAIAAMLT